MTTPSDDETATPPDPEETGDVEREVEGQISESDKDVDGLSGDAEGGPAPGGPNDPGASAGS